MAVLPTTLGSEPIGKLLKQYSIPAIIAMTAASLYNMVDSIFIGHGVGALAISGLTVTFPLINLAAAFGSLVGVGAGTLLSVKLGQKDYDATKKILGNLCSLNLIIGALFTVFTLLFLDPILIFFGASDATLPYAKDYMEIILWGNIITHMYLGLNNIVRAAGHPRQAMTATILTVILNAIFDPLFIFVFGWGIRGAAIATVLAQAVALVWIIRILADRNEVVHFTHGTFKLDRRIVTSSLSIGLSPFLMNTAACLIVIVINKSLQQYGGDLAIGAYGIVNRMGFLIVMIVMGLNQGMQPIAGYNFGARNYNRLIEVLRKTIIVAVIITTSGCLVYELIPKIIVKAFTSDSELIAQSVKGMRITFAMFPIVGFQMVVSNFFQSIGMVRQSIFLSLTRQLLFLLPGLVLLPYFWGIDGVWLAMPVSDLAAGITALILFVIHIRTFKQ